MFDIGRVVFCFLRTVFVSYAMCTIMDMLHIKTKTCGLSDVLQFSRHGLIK